ncbi:MAG: sensor histidine kinase N-terminal domain-containing protein [Nevskia sp.]|nr:sensor histidine kinase N-terminal domain-containing protein [Nevskia sp.]
MTSIRARLIAGLLALAAVVLLLSVTLTYRRILEETSGLFDYQLRQMALSLRDQASMAPTLDLPPQGEDADFVIQIWNPFGTRVYLSRPGLPMLDRAVLGYSDLSLQGQRWRAYALQTDYGVIQVAQPWRVREQLARAAALRSVYPLLLFLPLMAIAIGWTVGRGLAPLSRVAREVQQRDAYSLKPIQAPALPREISPLVNELNRLLARLSAAFETQRAFVADAAHELRSPLTALRLQVQLLQRAPDEAARRTATEQLGQAIDRAIHLATQLLTLARSESDTAAGVAAVELETAAREGAADTAPLAVHKQIDLALDAEPGVQVRGDAAALRILARNLIDNAVRYTPPGGRVHVRIARAADGAATLRVEDSGPGIPPSERERIFDRFYRRSGAPDGGSGLGLAIVRAIAERHGAAIGLDQAPGGGLAVTVRFASQPDPGPDHGPRQS